MTLTTTVSRIMHMGDGVSTSFAFPFKVWAASNLKVYVRGAALLDALQDMGVHYTVDVVAYPNSGNVVFVAPPSAAHTVVIVRDMPLTQDLDLVPSGAFAAENIETQLDKLAAEIQTLRELIARAPRFGVGSMLLDAPLPEPTAGVGNKKILGVTAAGDGFELKSPADLSLQTVSSFIGTLLDDADAATARATLGIGGSIDLNLLTTDSSGGATNDLCAFVDADESNASNKVTFQSLIYNLWNNFSQDTAPDHAADYLVTRDASAVSPKKVLAGHIGIGKQTVWIPAGSMTSRTTNGPVAGTVETTTNKVMIRTLDFDAAAAEHAQFQIQMPKGWNEGTVSALFVWSHAAATTSFGVVWGVQAVAVSDDDPLDVAFGSAATVTDTGGTTNDLYRSAESGAITIAGTPAENDVVVFQVYRDATNGSDTMAVDARLHGVALFYTTNANTDN